MQNGDLYEGNWINDRLEGYGLYRYVAGDEIKGNWSNDRLIGKGTYSTPDGAIFEGEWKENNLLPYGTFKYPNGDEYIGYVQRGARTGHGVYTEMLGNKLYANWDLDFVSENPVLPGIDWPEFTSIMNEIYDDIDRLNFKQFIQGIENPNLKRNIEDLEVDIKRCQGIYTIVGGYKYCGGWKNGTFEGKGLFTSRIGFNYYGEWKGGLRHGTGICIFNSELVYIGEWNNDKMEGIGRVENGKGYYSGAMKNGIKEGKGILKAQNGDIFDGYFHNDLPHGSGVLTLIDGRVINGHWGQDKYINQ